MIGLFVGRFQPFHNGHLAVVKRILAECELVKIGIGSAQESRTRDNPLSFEERELIIISVFEDVGFDRFEIYRLENIPDDEMWVAHVSLIVGEFDVMYAGDGLHRDLFIAKGHDVIHPGIVDGIHATDIRKLIRGGEDVSELVPEASLEFINRADFEFL